MPDTDRPAAGAGTTRSGAGRSSRWTRSVPSRSRSRCWLCRCRGGGSAARRWPIRRSRRRSPGFRSPTRSGWPSGFDKACARFAPLGLARLRLRGRRHDHAATARGQPAAADRARPRTLCARERDGAPEPRRRTQPRPPWRAGRAPLPAGSHLPMKSSRTCVAALDLCAPHVGRYRVERELARTPAGRIAPTTSARSVAAMRLRTGSDLREGSARSPPTTSAPVCWRSCRGRAAGRGGRTHLRATRSR